VTTPARLEVRQCQRTIGVRQRDLVDRSAALDAVEREVGPEKSRVFGVWLDGDDPICAVMYENDRPEGRSRVYAIAGAGAGAGTKRRSATSAPYRTVECVPIAQMPARSRTGAAGADVPGIA
jgi:hypothetical protein